MIPTVFPASFLRGKILSVGLNLHLAQLKEWKKPTLRIRRDTYIVGMVDGRFTTSTYLATYVHTYVHVLQLSPPPETGSPARHSSAAGVVPPSLFTLPFNMTVSDHTIRPTPTMGIHHQRHQSIVHNIESKSSSKRGCRLLSTTTVTTLHVHK